MLLTVVVGFAALLYVRVRAARLQQIDAALEAGAQYLEAHLRGFPRHELDASAPDRPPPRFRPPPRPPGDRPEPPPPFAPPPNHERLLAELTLPQRPLVESGDIGSETPYFGIWRSDGSLLKASHVPAAVAAPDLAEARLSPEPVLIQRGEYREAALRGPGGTLIRVGRSIERERAELRAFVWQLGGVGAVVLTVGLAGGWLISARILRPVAAIAATASSISATNLSDRIDPRTVDRELADLAGVLNAMFDRLEAAFERQARFTADASHELRTPLAILRSHTELALSRPRSAAEYRATVEAGLRAATRMTGLVEGLLTLARADAGKLDLRRQAVDLTSVVEECVSLCRALAGNKGITLSTHLGPVEVRGDSLRLGQVVTNLLSNAIQYNRAGGEVQVHLGLVGGAAVLSVQDTGCGIPKADRSHIFERFYRVDKARSRASGGNGLGLAICRRIVEAHGGTIGFETTPGQGTTFWVRLPRPQGDGPHE
jgi:heavy metal sensor kinase